MDSEFSRKRQLDEEAQSSSGSKRPRERSPSAVAATIEDMVASVEINSPNQSVEFRAPEVSAHETVVFKIAETAAVSATFVLPSSGVDTTVSTDSVDESKDECFTLQKPSEPNSDQSSVISPFELNISAESTDGSEPTCSQTLFNAIPPGSPLEAPPSLSSSQHSERTEGWESTRAMVGAKPLNDSWGADSDRSTVRSLLDREEADDFEEQMQRSAERFFAKFAVREEESEEAANIGEEEESASEGEATNPDAESLPDSTLKPEESFEDEKPTAEADQGCVSIPSQRPMADIIADSDRFGASESVQQMIADVVSDCSQIDDNESLSSRMSDFNSKPAAVDDSISMEERMAEMVAGSAPFDESMSLDEGMADVVATSTQIAAESSKEAADLDETIVGVDETFTTDVEMTEPKDEEPAESSDDAPKTAEQTESDAESNPTAPVEADQSPKSEGDESPRSHGDLSLEYTDESHNSSDPNLMIVPSPEQPGTSALHQPTAECPIGRVINYSRLRKEWLEERPEREELKYKIGSAFLNDPVRKSDPIERVFYDGVWFVSGSIVERFGADGRKVYGQLLLMFRSLDDYYGSVVDLKAQEGFVNLPRQFVADKYFPVDPTERLYSLSELKWLRTAPRLPQYYDPARMGTDYSHALRDRQLQEQVDEERAADKSLLPIDNLERYSYP